MDPSSPPLSPYHSTTPLPNASPHNGFFFLKIGGLHLGGACIWGENKETPFHGAGIGMPPGEQAMVQRHTEQGGVMLIICQQTSVIWNPLVTDTHKHKKDPKVGESDDSESKTTFKGYCTHQNGGTGKKSSTSTFAVHDHIAIECHGPKLATQKPGLEVAMRKGANPAAARLARAKVVVEPPPQQPGGPLARRPERQSTFLMT